MTEREQTEKLVERGTWLPHFNTARLTQADGTTLEYAEIDPRLRPTRKRIWVFVWKNVPSEEFVQHVEQRRFADWRFRLANG